MSSRRIYWPARGFAVLLLLYGLNTNAQPTPGDTLYRLSIAEKNVALDVTLRTISDAAIRRGVPFQSAFIEPMETFTNGGEAALLWTAKGSKNAADPLMLTIVFEPATQALSPQDFRAYALKKFAKSAQGIKHLDHGGIPLARYTADSLVTTTYVRDGVSSMGAKMTARNLEAYLVGDLVWARIQVSAGSLGTEEEKLFYSVIESAKFVDTSQPATSLDYYSLGRPLSAKKEYRRALANFASALKLERSNPQLNRRRVHDLIMKSAEAHVATSDLPAAVEVLEYGVTRDPTNETFQMQLARAYASIGDMAKTLATLKTTFHLMKKQKEVFEKTSFPGTTSHTMSLPDLNRDPAFKEMMKDKTFREAVKALKK